MLVGAIISIAVLAILGLMLRTFVNLPSSDEQDEHADPDNFGV